MSFAARVATATCLSCLLICVAVSAAAQSPTTPQDASRVTPAPGELSQTHWLRDQQTGCRAPDPDFAEGDDIVWAGACTNGMVDGPGTLTFLNKGQPQVTISGTFKNGDLEPGRASLAWPDGSKYDGAQIEGKFNGEGVFISAQNDRLEGEWKDGALNGHAIVTWANGNRYDGGWLNGKAEGHGVETWANGDRYDGDWDAGMALGHGVQVWANGQTYDGEWREDQPNGIGKLVRADGTTFSGKFVDGHPQGASDAAAASLPAAKVIASATPTAAPTGSALPAATIADTKSSSPRSRLGDVEGKKLLSVDGSSIALAESEGGFTRAIVKPDGATATTAFTFVNERMGTVADADDPVHVTGLFKMTDAEIDVDYSDGRSEVLRPGAGGVTLAMRTPDGQNFCMAWYPDGHAFSDAERRAALAAYASKLGVTLKGADAKPVAHSSACSAQTAATPPAATKAASGPIRNVPHPLARPIQASFEQPATPTRVASSSPSQPIFVRTSQVHIIDAPKPEILAFAGGQSSAVTHATPPPQAPLLATAPAPAPPSVMPASVALPTPVTSLPAVALAATAAAPAPPVSAAYQPDTTDPGASSCLSVASDGAHWGFKNSCRYSVQFAYCLKGDGEILASCKDGAISGSAAPDSFSALVADASLKESNVDHQFRWVACGGGAGEVIPKLDGVDPPVGRCLRARTAAR
jgi:hypothetical protein